MEQTFSLPLKENKLTTRQEEILLLLNNGYSYRQAGEKLGISHETVRSHAANIYRKLNVRNKTQALVRHFLSH